MLPVHAGTPEARIVDAAALAPLLDRLEREAQPSQPSDLNVALVEQRLAVGARLVDATLADALGPLPGRFLLLELRLPDGTSEWVPVTSGPRLRRLCGSTPAQADSDVLTRDLARLFRDTAGLPPEDRAARLTDFIMDAVDASRCALIPVQDGAFGEPLALALRRSEGSRSEARRIPRRVLDLVARSRQPVASADTMDPDAPLPLEGSLARQRLRSYMAVPIVFEGELLAVAFVDRHDQPGRFTAAEHAAFHAMAYELARPLLDLRQQQRARDYVALRDALLGGAPADATPSPAMREVLDAASRIARLGDDNILILGETGTGKEWLARWMHDRSGRRGRFVAVNVGAIPRELFESELMGVTRGAFTGAVDREGLVAAARGGTLFLDEIGDLDLASQVKLLRLLQGRSIQQVGSTTEIPVDVRIVAATNRPVEEMVARGDFRADLLHRFAPPLRVPPLRARREEILPLAKAWIAARARQAGVPACTLTDDAREWLERAPWRGNVRELQVMLSTAMSQARGAVITARTLDATRSPGPEPAVAPSGSDSRTWDELRQSLDAQEARWLTAALDAAGGNVDALSRSIGCARTTLRRALARHRIG